MPTATQAEKAVLGAVLGSRGQAILKLDFLEPKHFHQRENRQVYEAARAIWEQGGRPDYVTVVEHTGLPREAVNYYREFDEGVENVEEYGRLILAKWLARSLVDLGQRTANKAIADDPIEVMDDLEKEIMRLRPQRGEGFQRADMLAQAKLSDRPTLLPSGYPRIDSLMDGLGNGRLIILAARPGIGKTTLGLDMTANIARQGFRPGFFSFEMNASELLEKLVLAEAGVDSNRVSDYTLHEEDIERIGHALVRMAKWTLWLDDTANLSTFELATRAKRLKAEHGLDFLVVDYLQLISPPKAENRVNEVSIISRSLKVLARELDIPVLVLSQLSRQSEMGDGEPKLHQLRDSGSIESDADQVIFLWRDDKDPRNGPGSPLTWTHGKVAKNRHGRTGTFELALVGAQSKFVTA